MIWNCSAMEADELWKHASHPFRSFLRFPRSRERATRTYRPGTFRLIILYLCEMERSAGFFQVRTCAGKIGKERYSASRRRVQSMADGTRTRALALALSHSTAIDRSSAAHTLSLSRGAIHVPMHDHPVARLLYVCDGGPVALARTVSI